MPAYVLDAAPRQRWHTDGWCLLDDVFAADEIAAASSAVADLFPSLETIRVAKDSPVGADPLRWDAKKPVFPFESMALNRLFVHDALIDLAQDLLRTEQVRLYQGMASAKFSDGHPDYEQLLHVDYGNHTLVVPRADAGFQHLELFVDLSDVTPERAAIRIVSRHLTGDIPVERVYLGISDYASLYEAEEPAAGPAGSVLAYRPDVYHRGTALTEPGTVRFMLHVAFRPVATDWLGYQAWPQAAESRGWHRFMEEATLRQLTVLGFPEPGQDMTPWRRAEQVGG